MSTPNATTLLTFANVQMAAEAVRLAQVQSGLVSLADAPTFGNNRSSKFTPTQAAEFARDWEVVSQRNQRVTSFRSAEFADDAARDNQATNVLEIKEFGWAFWQIADMKTWVEGLGLNLSAPSVAVTGYSLGGHLATAFNLLYPGAATDLAKRPSHHFAMIMERSSTQWSSCP